MGVLQCFKFLREMGVKPRKHKSLRQFLLLSQQQQKPFEIIYVDVMSCFFRLFSQSSAEVAAFRILSIFENIPSVRLIFDGKRTVQKLQTAEIRMHESEKKLNQLQTFADAVHSETNSKAPIRKFNKALKKFGLPDRSKVDIVVALLQDKIDCVIAFGEADVYISRQRDAGNSLVITGDSDFLFHKSPESVAIVNRRSYQDLEVSLYQKKMILETLGISANQLLALAIVSANDYNRICNRKSISKNYELVKETDSSSLEAILGNLLFSRFDAGEFQHAISIFAYQKEELLTGDLLQDYQKKLSSMYSRLEKLKDQVTQAIKTRKRPKKEPEKWRVSRFAQENRFRPLQMLDEEERYSFTQMKVPKPNPLAFCDDIIPKSNSTSTSSKNSSVQTEKKKKDSTEKRPRKKSKKERIKIAGYSASSRSLNANSIAGPPRTLEAMNQVYKELSRKHDFKSWKVGTLDSRCAKDNLQASHVKDSIKWLVDVMNQVKDRGFYLHQYILEILIKLDNLINMVGLARSENHIEGFTTFWYGMPENLSYQEKLKRALLNFSLSDILARVIRGLKKDVAGKDYWQRLCHLLAKGKLSKVKNKVPLLLMIEDLPSLPIFLLPSLTSKSITKATNNIGEVMDRDFAGQVIGKLPLLIRNVLDRDPSKRESISAILELYPRCEILAFYHINQLLPPMDQFAFVPHKKSISNNYITVAEETILEACDKGTKAALFPDSDTVSPGALIEKVFGSNGFGGRKYATITKQQQPIVKAQKFILGKSVTTNGFDLAVLVIDTSTKKKPPLKGSSECYLSQAAKVQRKKKFSSDSIPDSFYQNPFQVKVTGVDVGQTYAVGICSNLGNPVTGLLSKTNLTIKTNALSQPCRSFTHYLENKKTDEIYRLERELERKPGENTKEYFSRRSKILPKLSSFYNSKAIMKAENNKDKAQRGEWDYATNQILKMHGYTIFDRHDSDRNPVLFVFGDCHVGEGTYSAFETYLVAKLRSLGFPVIFENEYYTSQKCPECHRQTELAGIGVRIKYCKSCDLHMHRDIMAGDNLSRIGLCLLLKRDRPGYLSKEKPEEHKSAGILDERLSDSDEDSSSDEKLHPSKRRAIHDKGNVMKLENEQANHL